jgi:membrane protease YdiL (CAAX protease family)
VGVLAALTLGLLAVYLIGGLSEFLSFGLEFLPFTVLAALAYAGRKNLTAMVFAYIMLAMTGVGVIIYSLINLLIGYIADADKFRALLDGTAPTNSSSLQGVFDPAAGAGLLLGVLLYCVAAVVAGAMLLRPVRVAMSRLMPIDPDDFVHKIALSILTLIVLCNFIPLLVLKGNPPLLKLADLGGTGVGGPSISIQPLDPVYQLIWTVPCVFVMAGWPIARRMPALLERLGLVRPTARQIVFGLGFGVALALISMFVIDPAINWIWQTLGWQTTNTAAFNQLLSNLTTPIGAVIIGVSAGLGEELQVRGLLQPRLGLLASNLVFTSLHAYQYGLDALLSVFIVGSILGIVRARSNTSTSAIVHGTYDFFLVMVTVLFPGS